MSQAAYPDLASIPKTSFACSEIKNPGNIGKCTLSGNYSGISNAQPKPTNYANFRKNLAPGDATNCGAVIETRGQIARIQTGSDALIAWIPTKYLFPKNNTAGALIDCHDDNRYYKKYGNWVQNNGRQFYKTGLDYVDLN